MTQVVAKRVAQCEFVDVRGQNDRWILMVHGFTQDRRYFSAQQAVFHADFRIMLPNLRGHGMAAHAAGPYGIEEYADDILRAMDDAGIEHAHYWGTHTGAAVGLVLALREPQRFASLVLEAPSLPGFSMPRVTQLTQRARSIAQADGIEAARNDWFAHADWFDHIRTHPRQCRAADHEAMLAGFSGAAWLCDLASRQVTPVADMLAAIDRPVLVYNGEHDLQDFKRAARHLQDFLPMVRREEIPDTGGFPAWENPHAVNLLVTRFFAEHFPPLPSALRR